MPDDAAAPLDTAADADGAAAADRARRRERQLWILEQLSEGGLRMAQAIERQATQEAPADEGRAVRRDLKGLSMAYARVARAVRLSVMLQARLLQEAQDGGQPGKAAGADDDGVTEIRYSWIEPEADLAALTLERKAHLRGIVGGIALAEREDGDAVERLVREAVERLDPLDGDSGLLLRPVSELVAHICAELGLDPDWPRLAEEAWARDERRLTPGEPLRALNLPRPPWCEPGWPPWDKPPAQAEPWAAPA